MTWPGARCLAAALCLVATTVSAQSRKGALGVTVAGGGEYVSAVNASGASDVGGRVPLEVGATYGVGDRFEVRLAARLAPGFVNTTLASSFYGGVRNSYGLEGWSTFFDLEAAVHVTPFITGGVRVAVGVQYDFLPIVGVYAQIAGQLGGATALRLSFEGMVGLQFRTYLLE